MKVSQLLKAIERMVAERGESALDENVEYCDSTERMVIALNEHETFDHGPGLVLSLDMDDLDNQVWR